MKLVKENLGKVAVTVDDNCWSQDKEYDRLVIVTINNAYKSYISRKPVPAGTSIANKDYWMPFSALDEKVLINYNSFKSRFGALLGSQCVIIDGLQKQINALNNSLNTGIKFSGNIDEVSLNTDESQTATVNLYFNTAAQATATSVLLYKNGQLVQEYTDTSYFTEEIEITDTTAFVLIAVVGNETYTSGWIVYNTYFNG